MVKKLSIIFLFFVACVTLDVQAQTTITGQAFTTTYTATRTSPVTFNFTNNSVTISGAEHYGLLAGAESTDAYNNNLDGATITGNKFTFTGSNAGLHGIMVGFNVDQKIKYNYNNATPYGIVYKADGDMGDVSGVCSYNIFKENTFGVRVKGVPGVKIYNNTFYNFTNTGIYISSNEDVTLPATGVKIKNNIFYCANGKNVIYVEDGSQTGFECDYNIYYCGGYNPQFAYRGTIYSWTQWRSQLGFDAHSVVMNPNFIDFTSFVPSARLDYGTNLGTANQAGLSTTATWTVGSAPVTTNQNGTWQVGAVVFTAAGGGNTYYVSTTGNNGNPGTLALPWRTWQYAFNKLVAGDILYVRGGIYTENANVSSAGMYCAVITNSYHSGTASEHIVIQNYPGETPILNCTGMTGSNWKCGLNIYGVNYWDITGLIVQGVPTTAGGVGRGWGIVGSSNITMTQCTVRYCGDGFFTLGLCNPLYWTNCDAYSNTSEAYDDGDFCNGWTTGGYGSGGNFHYYIEGCRSWNNSDDGFDFLNADKVSHCGYIVMNNCWAFMNGYGPDGNGVGFKMGGYWDGYCDPGINRLLTRCNAWDNTNNGFDENLASNARANCYIFNCTAYRNNTLNNQWCGGFLFSYPNETAHHYFYNNIAYGNQGMQANTPSNKCTYTNNTWNGVVSVGSGDFVSLDTAGVTGARGSDGSLPVLDFLKLADGSDLIDTGVSNTLTLNAGISYIGTAPDLGAYEYGDTYIPPVEPPTVSGNGFMVKGSKFVKSGSNFVKK